MMRHIFAVLAIAVFCGSAAQATGIDLFWDDCGPFGVFRKDFACDSNTGAQLLLVGSFNPPEGIQEFLGISAQVDIRSSSSPLPDWWALGPAQCRSAP